MPTHNAIDRTSQRFGRLTVVESTIKRVNGSIVWKCLCDCGKITFVSANNLRNGGTRSCGCLLKESCSKVGQLYSDITGLRSGRLVALEPTSKRLCRKIIWKCRCDCGNISFVDHGSLYKHSTKSCGCLQDATKWASHTSINPMDVPFAVTDIMKARRELKKAIKQAS